MRTLSIALAIAVAAPLFAADAPELFKKNCAPCHGADGSGRTPIGKSLHVKDLGSDEVQKMSGEELEKIILEGKGKMPSYRSKLSESDIDELVKLLRTFAPKK